MKITQEFNVAQSADTVYTFFQDVPAVSQCLPGAELTADHGDGSYDGTVSVKLGPMTATFEGQANVTSDAAARSGHIAGKGVDKRGGSRGQVKVDYSVVEAGSGASVTVEADVTLSGAAAQFGRTGLINQMSQKLIEEFVACLEAKLGASTEEEADAIEAAEVRGISLFLSTLGAAIGRFFKRLFGRR